MPAEPAVQEAGSARHRYSRLMDDAGLHILEQVTERARRGHPVEDGVVRLPATCRGKVLRRMRAPRPDRAMTTLIKRPRCRHATRRLTMPRTSAFQRPSNPPGVTIANDGTAPLISSPRLALPVNV
jgi:hypothetical protein